MKSVSANEKFVDVWRFVVEVEEEGVRIDRFLRDRDEISITRSQIKKLIDGERATVDDEPVRAARKLRSGEVVVLRVPPPEPLSLEPDDIPLDIYHEDEAVIVVNKPSGLVVHPAPGHPRGTLVNALLFAHSTAGGDPLRPGIVHRLDKDTSGLMVVAKTDTAHAALAEQFHVHSVDRRYQVFVVGTPPARGQWSTFHGRHPKNRLKFTSKLEKGKRAVSRFEKVEQFQGAARMQIALETGRTHQVRVHCHDHGYSVLGDPLYVPRHLPQEMSKIHKELAGQALHAEVLGFDHPVTGVRMRFESPLPTQMSRALEALRGL